MADSNHQRRDRDDALFERIRRTCEYMGWAFEIRGDSVWFDDGKAKTEVLLNELATDFEQAIHRAAARLSDYQAARRPVPSRQDSYSSAPWHEWDMSGRHISEKSG